MRSCRVRIVVWLMAMALLMPVAVVRGQEDEVGEARPAIEQLERELVDALAGGEVEVIDRLVSGDYRATDPLGHVASKGQLIELVRNQTFALDSVKVDELSVDDFGPAAVARGRLTLRGRWGQVDISGAFRFTDTWVRQEGQWRLVAQQFTRIVVDARE